MGRNRRTIRTFRTNGERRSIAEEMRSVRENNRTNFFPESLAWDAMIRDAKKQIEELKFSIELFERKKAAGERWPEAQSEDQGGARQQAV